MARGGVVLVLLAAGLVGCGGEERGEQRSPAAASSDEPKSVSGGRPSGTLFLRNLDDTLTIVHLESGETVTVGVPELAPGDPLFNLVETGGKLVFFGGAGGTYALDLGLKGPPKKLGDAWYFVPSATEGRVWLALREPESPDTVRDLRAVREVTVDGRTTVAGAEPPPCRGSTVVAAVKDGLLCQEDGLRIWDPVTGEVILELPGPFVADTYDNLVAWCDDGCPRLHLTDVRTGEDGAISPQESFAFEETYDGAFSPDGSLLALPVVTRGAAGQRHRVALVDVEEQSVTLIDGSELDDAYPAMTWSRSGEWLFFSAGGGRIMAYRPGSQNAILLPVEIEHAFVEMAAG